MVEIHQTWWKLKWQEVHHKAILFQVLEMNKILFRVKIKEESDVVSITCLKQENFKKNSKWVLIMLLITYRYTTISKQYKYSYE